LEKTDMRSIKTGCMNVNWVKQAYNNVQILLFVMTIMILRIS